jgi:tripartite ATP-independent transporter DctM subunit
MGHPLAFVLGGVGTIFGYFFTGPAFFNIFVERIYAGTMDNTTLIAIPLFIFMGNLLTISGVADKLFESLHYLLGTARGGLGFAVVLVCILFAACTGIVGASVVTMGLLTGPMLLRYGYQKELTMGMIAASGTLGLLIPPSIMLVIMSDQAGVPVSKIFASTVIPGLAFTILYLLYVLLRCTINPEIGPTIPKAELEKIPFSVRLSDSIIYALPPLALIVLVLGAIFYGYTSPAEAAGMGAFIALVMVIVYRHFTWEVFLACLYQTAKATTMVLIILVGASCFTGVFLGIGSGPAIIDILTSSGLSRWALYFIMMIFLIILGCFIDWVGVVIITFPIFLPIAKLLGFDIIWFVTMMALYLQISFLVPPFGYALFYLAGMKFEGIEWGHIYRGVLPFFIIQIIGVAVFTYFPEITLWLPSMMH